MTLPQLSSLEIRQGNGVWCEMKCLGRWPAMNGFDGSYEGLSYVLCVVWVRGPCPNLGRLKGAPGLT